MADHEHRAIEGWGLYSIFKESGRLLYQHFRILRPFILAFLFPLSVMVFLEVNGIAQFLTWKEEPNHVGGRAIFGHYNRHSRFRAFRAAFVTAPNPPIPPFVADPLVVFYTLDILSTSITWLIGSLASAAIAKAIHHIYSSSTTPTSQNEDDNSSESRTQTLIQSIFASLPHSLYRIFIISLCFFVVDVSFYFLVAVPLSLLTYNAAPLLAVLAACLCNLVFQAVDLWFQVSIQVVVLESQYDGWTALGRSAKLVKAKAATALGLTVVYFVFFFGFGSAVVQATLIPAHSVVMYVAAAAVALGYLVFAAFWTVVVTVFYFASERKWSGSGGGEYQALGVVRASLPDLEKAGVN